MSATVVDEEVNRVLVALSCSDGAVRLVFITARVHTAGIFIEAAEKRKSECLRIELMLSKSIIFSTGVIDYNNNHNDECNRIKGFTFHLCVSDCVLWQ